VIVPDVRATRRGEEDPTVTPPWDGAGVFRELLHHADFDQPAWKFRDREIWFAPCNSPIERLWGDTPAGRQLCPDCARIDMPSPPTQRGPSHG